MLAISLCCQHESCFAGQRPISFERKCEGTNCSLTFILHNTIHFANASHGTTQSANVNAITKHVTIRKAKSFILPTPFTMNYISKTPIQISAEPGTPGAENDNRMFDKIIGIIIVPIYQCIFDIL